MQPVTIRKLSRDEIGEAAYRLAPYAFSATPPLPDKEEFVERVTKRRGTKFYGAMEDGQAQAIAGSHNMTQNVRGKIYPITGLYAVSSHPAARRKGYARRVIAALLAEMREDGCVFSSLYPFRESFYERLGYVPFPQPRYVKLSPNALEPLLKQDLGGDVELKLNSENQDEYIAYTRKLQAGMHGMTVFDAPFPPSPQRYERWTALAKVDGEVVGAAVYSILGDTITQFTLRAENFYYSTPQGRYLLLEWLARHLNQTSQIEIWLAPDEFPETWYPDLDYSLGTDWKPPMSRVLDVAKIGGMQTGAGKFSARITDSYCPWNEGVWTFQSSGCELSVQAGGQAQSELSIQGLSALVFGVNDPGELAFRGWGNPPMELQEIMRNMFPRKIPYIHERF